MTDDPLGRLRALCFGPPGVTERLIPAPPPITDGRGQAPPYLHRDRHRQGAREQIVEREQPAGLGRPSPHRKQAGRGHREDEDREEAVE